MVTTLAQLIDRFEAGRRPVRVHRVVVMSPDDWRFTARAKGTLDQAALLRLAALGDTGIQVGVVAEIIEGMS